MTLKGRKQSLLGKAVCAYKNPHIQTFSGHWDTSKNPGAARDTTQGTGGGEWSPVLAVYTGGRRTEKRGDADKG